MKNLFIGLWLLVLIAGFGVSTSCAGMYVSGNLGAVFLDNSDIDDGVDTGQFSFDTGFGVTGAIGASVGTSTRLEAEFGYKANDMDELTVDGLGTVSIDGDVTILSLMGNAYYDFDIDSSFTPFVGLGLGLANVDAEIDTASIGSADDTVVAGQVMLGGSFSATEQVNIDLQYRFFTTADPDLDGLEAEISSHNLMVGLRYSF